MMKIAVTGLSGVIGNVFISEIPSNFEIIDLYNKSKSVSPKIKKHVYFNLFDKTNIVKKLEKIKPDVVLHMAAITHIDKCEKDKKNGKNGKVWRINVDATEEIAKYCKKNEILIVFLSTECVFDGKKRFYIESSKKKPINWYGYTKDKAEQMLLKSKAPVAIIRSVVAYHKEENNKTIYGKILNDLKSQKYISAVTDQLFTPTYTYDIVKAINNVIENKMLGIYHIAPKKSLSPYDFALLVADKNKYSRSHVKKTTLKSYYDSKRAALRLRYACLSGQRSSKILKFTPVNPERAIN